MRKLAAVLGLLFLAAPPCRSELLMPGVFEGYLREDRWGQKVFQTGPYGLFVADRVFEELRDRVGEPLALEVSDVYQPMNPGGGRIESVASVTDRPLATSIEVRVESSWVRPGEGVLVTLFVHNHAAPDLWWPPENVVLVVTASKETVEAEDRRASETVPGPEVDRWSEMSPWPYRSGFWAFLDPDEETLFLAARKIPIAWSEVELRHLDPCGFPRLPPGHTVVQETVAGADLPPGEYEIFAFWERPPFGDAPHGAMSNVVPFDVWEP